MRGPAPARPAPALLDAVPARLARRARALPTALEAGVLHVRSLRGDDTDPALDVLRVHVGAADVDATRDPDVLRHLLAAYGQHTLPRMLDDPVELLDTLLDIAAGSDASDLHLDPTPDGLRVRQRIDGRLHEVVRVPAGTVAGLVARTKVRSGLDVADRRLPQDGRLEHEQPGGVLGVRVATMPTRWGERITLRLLPDGAAAALDGLGLPDHVVVALRRAVGASDGLVVVCGPTGSGKTTTLHALIGSPALAARNVMTLEDPVERTLPGAAQTQVAPDHGLPFATGLRHLLRHDPDVLLVGEVRDRETARLAVEAAQTGHLVLTSLHAVDAPSALTRLHELDVPPGLIAETLRLVVAQRLLAVPCPDCSPGSAPGAVPGAGGCAGCAGTGTRGRTAVAEALEPDGPLRTLLRDGRGPGAHHARLCAAVGPRLRDVALSRAARGTVDPDDATRTTPDPS